MKLFIRIKDGKPFEHSILEDNFRQSFPDVDTDNLPPEFAQFERISVPEIGPYEVYSGVTYERDGAVFKDFHHIREMTESEKLAKQQKTKDTWAQNGFTSWIFDETLCEFVPPTQPGTEDKADLVRSQRDSLLAQSDIKVLSDRWAVMTPEQQAAWATYRQALRDITAQPGFPWTVDWPTMP